MISCPINLILAHSFGNFDESTRSTVNLIAKLRRNDMGRDRRLRGAYSKYLDPVRRKLKRAVRLIGFKKQREHSAPLFKSYGLLNLDDCYKLECAKFMYDVSKGKVEEHLQKLFQLVNSRHNIQTRQATAGHLSQPLVRTNYKQNFITNYGVKVWNEIPRELRDANSKKVFTKRYKTWLLDNYN